MRRSVLVASSCIVLQSLFAHAQTITSIQVAPDGGIILTWDSQADVAYRVDYAPQITSPMDWRELYGNYASHGSSTFWKDVGNEGIYPPASHPRDDSSRFYRVVAVDTNSSSPPSVTVVSPAAGSTLTGDTTVQLSLASPLAVDGVRLFVDGGEAGFDAYDATSFPLNTCQFPNGTRKLFGVAGNFGGGESTDDPSDMFENFVASSPTYTVTFDNLISEFSASSFFIEPATNGTIRFRAKFAANANWTFRILNSAATAVRTVTGTGTSLLFDWNGKGDGDVPLPQDTYQATLEAGTVLGPTGLAQTTTAQTADVPVVGVAPDGSFAYFSRSNAIAGAAQPQTADASSAKASTSTQPAVALQGPTSQATTLTPTIIMGLRGTIAIGRQGHHPSTAFAASTAPSDGLGGTIRLNASAPGGFGPLKTPKKMRDGFEFVMRRNGFRLIYDGYDDKLKASDLRAPQYGGTGEFNKANLGLLIGHGVYGFDPDFTISASGPLQTYYPVYKTGDNFYDWVRSSQYDFGSSTLRWMGIITCNNLFPDCYDDMYAKELLPINDNLHLLLGCATTSYMVSMFGIDYGNALTGTSTIVTPRLTIKEAWFFAGRRTQGVQPGGGDRTVIFRVAGWPNNFTDDLATYQDPNSGNPADITFEDRQVHP